MALARVGCLDGSQASDSPKNEPAAIRGYTSSDVVGEPDSEST